MRLPILTGFAALVLALPAWSASYSSLLQTGDRAFAQRQQPAAAEQARALYLEASNVPEAGSEVFWRLARSHYWLAHRLPKASGERSRLAQEGVTWAEAALKLDRRSAAGNYWHAMNLMLLGESQGIPKALKTIGTVRAALKQAASTDPAYWGGGAYRMLGKIELKAPWPIGDKRKAVDLLQQALTLGPSHPDNRLYLAEALIANGDKEKARQLLQALLAPANAGAYGAEAVEARREARALLDRL